ncbi:hypothetical protein [Streptomyces sp. NPDC048002]|uniref:hypothetical protein n=1 Tax=Streptomyces sp. NPDC048002 TaxID=3154344 RepID=UPI0033E603A8
MSAVHRAEHLHADPLLPRHARRDLASLLADIDRELLRRTLPDVFAHREPWRRGAWWWTRLYDTSDLE